MLLYEMTRLVEEGRMMKNASLELSKGEAGRKPVPSEVELLLESLLQERKKR